MFSIFILLLDLVMDKIKVIDLISIINNIHKRSIKYIQGRILNLIILF